MTVRMKGTGAGRIGLALPGSVTTGTPHCLILLSQIFYQHTSYCLKSKIASIYRNQNSPIASIYRNQNSPIVVSLGRLPYTRTPNCLILLQPLPIFASSKNTTWTTQTMVPILDWGVESLFEEGSYFLGDIDIVLSDEPTWWGGYWADFVITFGCG